MTADTEAEALADAILKAAGSGLRHYSMTKTRSNILAAAQHGIDTAKATTASKLREALNYLLEQTVDMDLKHGITLSEGEEDARQKAMEAIAEAST